MNSNVNINIGLWYHWSDHMYSVEVLDENQFQMIIFHAGNEHARLRCMFPQVRIANGRMNMEREFFDRLCSLCSDVN